MANSNKTNSGKTVANNDELISDEVRVILLTLNFSYICQLIDVLGTGTNVVNIICFFKHGFKETVNISLFALSVADLFCLVALLWNNICLNPLFYLLPFIPFDPYEIVYITAAWPHFVFARISACITAFISTERCLCIVFPLKVKRMVTRKRVTVIIVCIYVILIGSVSPEYYCNRFSWKFYRSNNRSVLQIDSTIDRQFIEDITFAITNVMVPCLTFLLVIVTTAVLVVKLQRKARWRQKSAASRQSDAMFNRDQKLSKMVIVMSSVFVACYGPVCVIFVAMIIEEELSIYGQFKNLFGVVFSIAYIMESISVSMNFVIYYKMSSRYRAIVRTMFCLRIKTTSGVLNSTVKSSEWMNKQDKSRAKKNVAKSLSRRLEQIFFFDLKLK